MELTCNNCKGRNFNTYYIDTLEEFARTTNDRYLWMLGCHGCMSMINYGTINRSLDWGTHKSDKQ